MTLHLRKSEGLPDGTPKRCLEVIVRTVAAFFDVDWEISHESSDGPLGYIRNGIATKKSRDSVMPSWTSLMNSVARVLT